MSNGHGELLTLRMQREGSEPCVDEILILPGPRGRKTAKWKGNGRGVWSGLLGGGLAGRKRESRCKVN